MSHYIWDVDPALFSIGGFSLYWYGILFTAGFLLGYPLMRWIYRREHRPPADLDRLLLYMFSAAVIGARLGEVLFYDLHYYLADPLAIFAIRDGGLSSHGGTLGMLLAVYLYIRRTGDSYLWLVDRLSMPIALGSCMIRLGNFFNSEIYGLPGDKPWAIIFARVDMQPRHPAQLYEAICYLLTFILLVWLYRRHYRKPLPGLYIGIMFIAIFTSRFFIERFKPEYADIQPVSWLNMGQLLSIPFILLGGVFMYHAFSTYRQSTHRT